MEGLRKEEGKPWRVLEFYSGIGGMRYSLMNSGVDAEVVEAFDITDVANDVYEHNFGHRPHQAKRVPLSFPNAQFNNKLLWTPGPVLGYDKNVVTSEVEEGHWHWDKLIESCRPIKDFLEFENSSSEVFFDSDSMVANVSGISKDTEGGIVSTNNPLNDYLVPSDQIERWGSAMDIVFPESKRCCCFTKSYFRYVKGTGSLLATVPVANLHSFPEGFQFPEHVSLRQRTVLFCSYALLGNSLSVGVVAPLLRYLFTHHPSP